MPVIKCSNGKYRIGNSDCKYDTEEQAEKVWSAIIANMAEVGERGGIKASPKAPKSDTKNPNPKGEGTAKGDASGKRGAKVTAEQEKTLENKVKDFNEKESNTKNGKATLGALKSVFQRGLGAFNTSRSPVVKSAEQWAYARVNAFLYLLKNGRPENAKYITDYDLLPKGHPKEEKFIECDKCGHDWDLEDGGESPYKCHKCNNIVVKFESYNDYPESAVNAAKRAVAWAEKNGWGSCLTAVGKIRASQIANKENISKETISKMASFARHLQYKDVPYSEGCGGIAVDAWGGQAGIEWAQNKLKELKGE